jgi:hypothetical protein
MAEWVDAHPEWEGEAVGGTVPSIPLVIPLSDVYVAPRADQRPPDGRQIRQAACGHEVLVSEAGIDAIDRRGKRLMCDLCQEAMAAEQGARLGVTDSPI